MRKTILILVCTFLISGCYSFIVRDKDGKDKIGIPFYIKKGVVKQTTTYTRSWIEATINYYKIDDKEKIPGSDRSVSIAISEATYNQIKLLNSFVKVDASARSGGFDAAVKTIQEELDNSCGKEVKDKVNCVISQQIITKDSSPKNESPESLLQVLESNTFANEAIVDYDNIYYFNVKAPTFGTTSATAKLASDGTLTEVSSTVDSTKTADLIPLKELLVDKWGLEEIAKKGEGPPKYSLTLSISVNGYKYELTKYHQYEAGLNLPPLQFDTEGISVNRVKFGSDLEKTEQNDKKTISIEGSILFPENKDVK